VKLAQRVLAVRGAGEDRVAVAHLPSGVLLAVADGAGGIGNGALAAEAALRAVSTSGAPWVAALERADRSVELGECAIVVAFVSGSRISGASVGDCGAWLIGAGVVDLTAGQIRKPLPGSRSAAPVAFEADLGDATLLLASDGLLKYAKASEIAAVARGSDLGAVAEQLAALPRLRSGDLPDDVAVILCRAN
jgi:serine/threonine protein phosphatase PrpC